MPLCTLHLVSLAPGIPLPAFLHLLSTQSPPIKPLVTSRVIRWIITPTTFTANELLHPPSPWDVLLILPSTSPLPTSIFSHIQNIYTLTAGIPSRITSTFASQNPALLHPDTSATAPLDPPNTLNVPPPDLPSDSQSLTLSPDLLSWMQSFSKTHPGRSPLSMLNLLAFHNTPTSKSNYQKYGKAFAERIGSRHGGNAKIVGNVIGSPPNPEASDRSGAGWQEIALAQYPSIAHFGAMLGSPDYQSVNQEFRVPSLSDTCILCTSEIAVEEELKEWEVKNERGGGGGVGKGSGMGIGERAGVGRDAKL